MSPRRVWGVAALLALGGFVVRRVAPQPAATKPPLARTITAPTQEPPSQPEVHRTQPTPTDRARAAASPPRGRARRRPSARVAALAFIASYLAVTYGQAPPEALRAASAAVRARFVHAPPHVSADVVARDPRVISLRLEAAGAKRQAAVAAVSDGQLSYLVTFALERQSHVWRVVDVAGS